jgi:hypothetical protein
MPISLDRQNRGFRLRLSKKSPPLVRLDPRLATYFATGTRARVGERLTMLLSRHTRRREFITLLGGAAAWPLAAFAQYQPARIALLDGGRAQSSGIFVDALKQGLADNGLIEGRPRGSAQFADMLIFPVSAGIGTVQWQTSRMTHPVRLRRRPVI